MSKAILRRMIRELETRGVHHPLVLDGMGRVPRERFVDEALRETAYSVDAALPIGALQTITQPWMVARMTELLDPDGSGRVLEIGTGSGYHAAVLSRVFEQVYTVERIPELSRRARRRIRALGIENVHFKIFDGGYGWSEFSPYRGIVVTASAPEVPPPLLRQLAPGGRLVAPVGPGARTGGQTLVRLVRAGDGFTREDFGACRFVPLRGKHGWTA